MSAESRRPALCLKPKRPKRLGRTCDRVSKRDRISKRLGASPRAARPLALGGLAFTLAACAPADDQIAASVLVSLPIAYFSALMAVALMISLWRRWIPEEVDVEWRWHLWVVGLSSLGLLAIGRVELFDLLRLSVCVIVGFTAMVCVTMRFGRSASPDLWLRWMPPAMAGLLASSQVVVLLAGDSHFAKAFALSETNLVVGGLVLGPLVLAIMFVGSVVRWDASKLATPMILDDEHILDV